ncbi:ABC transporter permease [Bacillus salitolerans]|uniref:ABC transporter permease n=1 Tax=Bacillus salitolerans TaxID=1437434 RepID=A0ABW4LQR1_9BACI
MKYLKQPKIEDIIFIVFLIVSCLILLIIGLYSIKQSEMDKLSNDFYSKNSIHLLVNEKKYNLFDEVEQYLNNHEFILFKEHISSNPNLKGVYSNGDIDIPPLIKGTFFEKEDYERERKVAVIGRDVKEIVVKNNKSFIYFNNIPYEIIGVMGGPFKSKLDYSIYINLTTLPKSTSTNVLYVIDGSRKTKHTVQKFLIKENKKIVELDIERKGSSVIINENISGNLLNFLFLLILLCSNILSFSFWIYKKRLLISVQYLIGLNLLFIFFILAKNYLLMLIFSFGVGFLLFIAFNINEYISNSTELNNIFLTGFASYIALNLVLFLITIPTFSPIKLMKVLK